MNVFIMRTNSAASFLKHPVCVAWPFGCSLQVMLLQHCRQYICRCLIVVVCILLFKSFVVHAYLKSFEHWHLSVLLSSTPKVFHIALLSCSCRTLKDASFCYTCTKPPELSARLSVRVAARLNGSEMGVCRIKWWEHLHLLPGLCGEGNQGSRQEYG